MCAISHAIVNPAIDTKFQCTPGRLANWDRRTRIINYCVDVLDASYQETKHIADEADRTDLRARRKTQAELYSAGIKVGGGFQFPSDLAPS